MKILIVNKSFNSGGAAVASQQLFTSLLRKGIDVKMMVFDPTSKSSSKLITLTNTFFDKTLWWFYFIIERLYFYRFEKSADERYSFSPAIIGADITKTKEFKDADIIHINWHNQGFLSNSSLKKILESGKNVVFTMHDMWLITGGCHHAWGCVNFEKNCGNCKFLKSPSTNDLSFKIFRKKRKIFTYHTINIITVSDWLKNKALKSNIINNRQIAAIPNIIDVKKYSPLNIKKAKQELSLDCDKKYILFGAHRIDDNIKGLNYLIDAINIVLESREDIGLILFGGSAKNPKILNNIKAEVFNIGKADLKLKLKLYSAAEITCVPSLYETFGLVAAESLSCETPVLAFDNSGIKEVVEHKIDGYLAEYKSSTDLAAGINWILDHNPDNEMGKKGRKKITEFFNEDLIANNHIKLYKKLIEKND